MRLKRKNKTLISIILVLTIPVILFGMYEVNSLTSDEEELTTLYRRQLESVLFSVNEAAQSKSDEVLATILSADFFQNPDKVLQELTSYPFFISFFSQDVDTEEYMIMSDKEEFLAEAFQSMIDSLVNEKRGIINSLVRYVKDGQFQKIQAFEDYLVIGKGEFRAEIDYLFFVTEKEGRFKINIYLFDAAYFIEEALAPKFQELSQGDFVITSSKIEDGSLVYSTSGELVGTIESEPLDLMPRFNVGIARVGGTIEDAVEERRFRNIIALYMLLAVLLVGVGLVFRNVQKEVELAQRKADFVSNVSHEIRTPLALINMFAETLLLGRVRTEEKKNEYYEIITKEVGRLTNMVNRILSFSKMEANKRVFNKSVIDLNQLVSEVHTTYSYHLENNGFTHELELNESALDVSADKEAITEVMVNLIDNAMKYSADNKSVTIRTRMNEGFAVLEVEDKGMGIPKQQLGKLFEKFYRVPTGDVHNTKGAGLGLTLVKHIIESHEGTIDVDSTVGKGSIFRVSFPIVKTEHV